MIGFRAAWRAGAGLIAIVLPLLIGGCGSSRDPDEAALAARRDSIRTARFAPLLPPGFTVAMADSGRQLFVTCMVCHAPDGTGTDLGPSLRDDEWIEGTGSAREIESAIRNGVSDPHEFSIPMPVMGGGLFDDDQVRALTAYVYLISHDTISGPGSP